MALLTHRTFYLSRMNTKKYIPASPGKESFHCPYCGVCAHQSWWETYVIRSNWFKRPVAISFAGAKQHSSAPEKNYDPQITSRDVRSDVDMSKLSGMFISSCFHCQKSAIWINKRMIYPNNSTTEMPHEDLPDNVKTYYNEARDIFNISVRGAMALLRLSLQELCKHLGLSEDINKAIEELVNDKSLSNQVKKSLDIIRVTGNHAVHPGLIDFNDSKHDAQALFGLINEITDTLITKPKKIDEIHSKLPEKDLKRIEKRDKKASGK